MIKLPFSYPWFWFYFRPESDDGNAGEVIDPYVEIRIRGHEIDYNNSENNQKTEHVKNNGFNPTWRESFTFDIKFPDLAILDLKVSNIQWWLFS